MLKLPSFELLRPENRAELCTLMKVFGGRFKLLAGGTDLINGMKKRLYQVEALLSLTKMPALSGIVYDHEQDKLTIGALTTLTDLEMSKALHGLQNSLVETVRLIAAPPIRNRATVGGNLCLDTRCYYYNQSDSWRSLAEPCYKSAGQVCNVVPGAKRCQAVFSADLPPLLLALGAQVVIADEKGERVFPLANLYTGDGVRPNSLQEGEYVTGIVLDGLQNKNSSYKKFRLRKALDFPLAGLALAVDRSQDNRFVNPVVVINAVASGPLVVPEAAARLAGKSFTDEAAVAAASAAVMAAARPIANVGSKPFYRKKMIGLLLKKSIAEYLS